MKSIKDLIKPDQQGKKYPPEWLGTQFAEVPLSKKVPKKIRDMVYLAYDLAYYGYFKYEFFNLALFYLTTVLEAALKEKYNLKHGYLSKLLKRAKNDKLLHKSFYSKLSSIKDFRNANAHPSCLAKAPVVIKGFHIITYLINCIFDKKERQTLPPIFAKEIAESRKIESLFD